MRTRLELIAGTGGVAVRVHGGTPPAPSGCTLDRATTPEQLRDLVADHLALEEIELTVPPEVVEQRVTQVGLICLGLARRPFERLPATARIALPGGIDISGVERTALDRNALNAALAPVLTAHALEGWAISGVNSGRNPVQEAQTAAQVRQSTGLPVLEARFWGEDMDAGQRALAAARGMARLLTLFELQSWAFRFRSAAGCPAPVRAGIDDRALIAAMLDAPDFTALAPLVDASAGAGLLQARITRSESRYVCHCTDGVFRFDSITQARSFADHHLREQFARVSARLGGAARPAVVQADDRYAFVRGRRGPVRVYLETILTVRPGP